jgi:protein-tyrosine phosphatase
LIDLHCHVLPGLDDGARDLEDSIAMARQAVQDGIGVVCATPHLREDHDVRLEEIPERVASLQGVLRERGIEVRIVPAAELAQASAEGLDHAGLQLAAYGARGGWVLLEPAPGPLGDGLQGLVERLAADGVRTVVAHPERHAGADFRPRLQALVSAGALIQWTAEFLALSPAEGPVTALARDGLVHVLGSDSHSSRAGRAVRLTGGFEWLARAVTAEQLEWSRAHAPAAVLRGEPVPPRPAGRAR